MPKEQKDKLRFLLHSVFVLICLIGAIADFEAWFLGICFTTQVVWAYQAFKGKS